jgi:hypothetical protein
LVSAWNNTTPVEIIPLNCTTNPQANFICQSVWVLDNTVFAVDSPALILVYLLIGLGALFLIVWIIEDVRDALLESGKVA